MKKSILFLFILIFLFHSCEEEEISSPNIILFFVDDLGWQDTSVPFWNKKTKWNNQFQTPNM